MICALDRSLHARAKKNWTETWSKYSSLPFYGMPIFLCKGIYEKRIAHIFMKFFDQFCIFVITAQYIHFILTFFFLLFVVCAVVHTHKTTTASYVWIQFIYAYLSNCNDYSWMIARHQQQWNVLLWAKCDWVNAFFTQYVVHIFNSNTVE